MEQPIETLTTGIPGFDHVSRGELDRLGTLFSKDTAT